MKKDLAIISLQFDLTIIKDEKVMVRDNCYHSSWSKGGGLVIIKIPSSTNCVPMYVPLTLSLSFSC